MSEEDPSKTPTKPDLEPEARSPEPGEYDSEEALREVAADFEQAIKSSIEELGERLTPMVAASVVASIAAEFLVKLGVTSRDAREFFTLIESQVRQQVAQNRSLRAEPGPESKG